MPDTHLVVVDPGHFHATLVQQEIYPGLSPLVRVHAPLGPDLIDYLNRITRYNRRSRAATDWRLDVHAGPDFLDWMRDEPPGGVAIFSGRNRGKIERIIAALETGPQDRDAVLPWKRISIRYADGCEIVLDGENKDDSPFLTGPKGTLTKSLESSIPDLIDRIKDLPDPAPQVTDFVQAVKTRQKFALNEINGHRSCTLINLAKIAVQTGRPLRFDSKTQRFVDDAGANAYVEQPMRAPWKITV